MRALSQKQLSAVAGGEYGGAGNRSSNTGSTGSSGVSNGTCASIGFGKASISVCSSTCTGSSSASAGSTSCSSSGGGGGSRVICTHFFRKGQLRQDIWRADMEFTFKNLSQTTIRGYHLWAIPYVRLMRKSPLAEKIMRPLAIWRAEELAYKMGVLEKGNWKGKVVRVTCEPICFALGLFAKEQNWASLWTQTPQAAQAVENTPAA